MVASNSFQHEKYWPLLVRRTELRVFKPADHAVLRGRSTGSILKTLRLWPRQMKHAVDGANPRVYARHRCSRTKPQHFALRKTRSRARKYKEEISRKDVHCLDTRSGLFPEQCDRKARRMKWAMARLSGSAKAAGINSGEAYARLMSLGSYGRHSAGYAGRNTVLCELRGCAFFACAGATRYQMPPGDVVMEF